MSIGARHFDVVVLGRSLGALCCAALLARRDFRVLVLGQASKPAFYRYENRPLCRRPFTLVAGASPTWRRILHELSQTPHFRRRTRTLDPMFVILEPGRRLEVAPDMELFAREIDREFSEVRQLVDELYSTFAQVNARADAAFERDAVWPPGNLWERLETGRIAAGLPFAPGEGADCLSKFPAGHPYRQVVALPALFATDLAASAEQLPPFALARLHGAWTRGIVALSGGEDELADFLVERIRLHGGEVRLEDRATSLIVRRGIAAGVLVDGEDEATGADAIVTSTSGEALADLSGGQGITRRARRDWPRLSVGAGRFVVSLVVKRAGLPDSLSHEAFVIPSSPRRPDPRRPIVHLQRFECADLPSGGAPDESLLVAEALLPARGPLTLLEAREAVLATVREHLPFIERHTLIVDSVHDGLPLTDHTTGTARDIDRVHIPGSSAAAELMLPLWTVEPAGYFDLAAEPLRGPVPGTFLVGRTVLPALGQEGELLAALSVAHLITRKDKHRQKMRRHLWTKLETT